MLEDHDHAHEKHISELENWGEGKGNQHQGHQPELLKHNGFHHSPSSGIFGFMDAMKKAVDDAKRTGPAPDHKFGAILPMHNLLKPGAHPAFKNKD